VEHLKPDCVCLDREALRERAGTERHLWIDAGAIPSWARGALDDYLGSRIEERLSEVDALRRSGSVSREFARLLEDQLYRARLVGYDGLSVGVHSFDAIAPHGVLASDDSASLLGWLDMAERGLLRLALPESVRQLRGFRRTEAVALWLDEHAALALVPEDGEVESVVALTQPSGVPAAPPDPRPEARSASDPIGDLELALPDRFTYENVLLEATLEDALLELGEVEDAPLEAALADEVVRVANSRESGPIDTQALPHAPFTVAFWDDGTRSEQHDAPLLRAAPEPEAIAESDVYAAGPSTSVPVQSEPQFITRRAPRIDRALNVAQIPLFEEGSNETTQISEEVSRANQIRELCAALSSAHGATSFASLEELFLTAYCPLEQAVGDDPAQSGPREVLSRWATQFQTCYQQAFERMRLSRQRPRMAFDAPKLAFQLSRAHDAPGFELVMVDAFRFDVGQRVYDKLRLQLSGQAECVERGLLWAPLPSNTAATLELLARGADGLRALKGDLKESTVVSIKEARRLRKLRVGPHSLFKLDAIQTLLEPGKSWDGHGLDQLAAEVSVSSARFIRQKPTGTLVFLFGDHGFRLSDGGHGGATPSEVLVPYQAWRVLASARATAAE
jgi:hypothetical protein